MHSGMSHRTILDRPRVPERVTGGTRATPTWVSPLLGSPLVEPPTRSLKAVSNQLVPIPSHVRCTRAATSLRCRFWLMRSKDTGCDNKNILSHCWGDGPHVRGYWVGDLVLGEE